MTTIKQQKALNKTVENGGNISKAMREVGYSKNTAKNPKKLTESKGFKELCSEKGLTDNFLLNALVADIKAKKGNRRAELELGFKITGKLNPKNMPLDEIEKPQPILGNVIIFENMSKRDDEQSTSGV